MGKHKVDKKSKDIDNKQNKAGKMPQNPKAGSNAYNMYR